MHPSALPAHTQPQRVAIRPDPTSGQLILRALTALLLAAVGLLGLSPAAHAHDTLTDSSPAEGETLDEPPTQVRLTFSAEVLELGAAAVVTDGDGATWEAGEPTVAGVDVTVPLKDGLPNGSYEVSWRVTSSDGHPISGVIPFTVDAPATDPSPEEPTQAESDPTSPAPATSEPTTTEETSEPTAAEPAPATTAQNPQPSAAEESEGGLPWVPILIGLGIAAVAYAVVRVVRRGSPDQGGEEQ